MNVGLFIQIIYGIVFFLTAAGVSHALCPAVRQFSYAVNALDIPDGKRKKHTLPTPRLGGIAVAVGFLVPCLGENIFSAMLFGGAVIVLMGLFDDIRGILPATKLLLQVIASLSVMSRGVMLESVNLFGTSIKLGIFSPVLTVILVVAITNSFNLIDGIDGLSAGQGVISSLLLAVVSAISKDLTLVGMSLALAGACVGFLPHNFKRRKLFLGDLGAQFVGFILSIIIIGIISKENNEISLVSLLFVAAYPLFETVLSIIRRLKKRKNPMIADRGHLHYRIIDRGVSEREALVYLLTLGAVLGMSGVCLTLGSVASFVVVLAITTCILLCGLYVIFPSSLKYSRQKKADRFSNAR